MKITLKNMFKITSFSSFFFTKIFFTILFLLSQFRTVANMDASHPWQIGFQDPATPIMEGIIFFNGFLMSFMILIACLVGWLLYKSLSLFDESVHANSVNFTHSTLLEVVWTIIPAVILMIISIPSYNLLYAMDEVIDPSLTIKVVGHQWYWSYECSDFEVAPKVEKEEVVKLFKGVKEGGVFDENKSSDSDNDSDDGSVISDLMDFDKSNPYWEWCELIAAENKYDSDDANLARAASDALVSERTCTNAAATPENNNTPFSELMENMKQDGREFKKAIPIADLSEDKLIDTQLIEHQLRLTRPEREVLSSEYAWNSAVVASNFAEFEFKNALAELNSAKLHSHWAKIELAASNVNKLTAEYLQADASLGVTDPLLIRSLWINKKGYYSWNDFLRLAIKKLSDVEKLVFLHADEELNGANSLLGKAQRGLTIEEREKSNSIADNAKAEFMAMEREVIPAIEEFMRGKVILANAKSELTTFQEISDRADTRLEKAQISFDQAKSISDRTQARLNAAEFVFRSAQAKLTGSEIIPNAIFTKSDLDLAELRFKNLTKEFDQAILNLSGAKSDLLIAEERLDQVKMNFEKTKKVFEDTGLLEKQTPVEGKPTEYYHNFLWEIHNEDLAFVKAQLKTDKAELEFAKTSLDVAEKNVTKSGGELLEAELKSNKALINYLNDNNNSDLTLLNNAKNHVSGLELEIAEAIYTKALSNFELHNSNESKLLLDKSAKALSYAKLNATDSYSGSVLDNNFNNIDSKKLISSYAESCLISAQEELKGAQEDYAKASSILAESENLLKIVAESLNKNYDNPYLDTLKALHKNTVTSLEERVEQFNLTKLESSPLTIKLEPGLLQSKSYQEVLLAKAELANIKWLCARVARTLDIPLSEEVKPFNVQFSHLKCEDSSIEGDNVPLSDDSGSEGSDDKKVPKTLEELLELIPKLNNEEVKEMGKLLDKALVAEFYERVGIVSKIIEGGLDSLSMEEVEKLTKMAEEAQASAITAEADKLVKIIEEIEMLSAKEEASKNQEMKSDTESINEEFANSEDDDEDDEEEIQRINFDSYLIADDDLVIPEVSGTGKAGTVFRLLEVDNRLFVPTNTHIRLLVTSADVLHSWAVPSLGVKVDACPGRLNQVFLFVKREGVFYGQCSELCGVNHGFMPIVVQAVSQDEYLTWVGKRLCS